MEKIKTLAAITIGALVLSAAYAMSIGDRSADFSVDSDTGRSTRHVVHGDRGEFILKEDDIKVEASWRGEFELDPLGTDIERLGRKFEITHTADGVSKRALFERSRGDIKRSYFVDDAEQADGPETDAAITELLVVFLRASGMKAEERVTAFLKQGGADAVLQEMTHLDSDHSLRRYTEALTEQADLSGEQLTTLVALLKNVESDHDLRRALGSIMDHEDISAELTPVLIDAAGGIESDHDLRKLMEAFAERSLNGEAMDLALGLFERIESDYDLRIAAVALLENSSLDNKGATRLLLAAADQVEGDHDMRLILDESAELYSKDPELTAAWLKAYGALESDHDQRLIIEEVADEGDHPVAAWKSLIEATSAIEGDHEQRLALEAIAEEMGDDPALIEAYREAAADISSDSDRKRALEAIVDTED